ncbi:hypothetical protein M8J75_005993 [Diaphorina citri]|nr:hypothetical protein M8J75_005993 [Diaphorina citri]
MITLAISNVWNDFFTSLPNKLRFGLPTVDLIRAYDPSGRPISERSFKYMKSLLFGWPVGQALLTNPGDFAESLRPSKDEYNIFLKGLAPLKRFCISREAANEELRKEVLPPLCQAEEGSVPETGVIRTPSYESLSPSRPAVLQVVKQQLQPVNDRLSRFEERFDAFQTNITALLAAAPRSSGRDHGEDAGSESFSFRSDSQSSLAWVWDAADDPWNPIEPGKRFDAFQTNITALLAAAPRSSGRDHGEDAGSESFSFRSDSQSSLAWVWDAADDPWNPIEPGSAPPLADTSDFAPHTTEMELDVPEASETLKSQLMKCQCLDSPGWDRVRYVDSEVALKHAAPFQPLLSNPSLPCSNREADFQLRKMERMACHVSYGLLAQREAFQAARREMIRLVPATEPLFRRLFTGEDSEFKKTSFHLLQYTCGKRAEIIQGRRKLALPSDQVARRALSTVHPSGSHLFNEEGVAKIPLPPVRRARPSAPPSRKRQATAPPSFPQPAKVGADC